MNIKIIGVDNCTFCDKANWLVSMPGYPHTSQYVKVSREDKKQVEAFICCTYETYPVVILDGKYIGGLKELVSHTMCDDEGNIII